MGADSREAVVRLGADSSKLDGQLSTGRSKFRKFASDVKSELKTAGKEIYSGLATIGGFAGVAGLALGTKNVLDFERGLGRLSARAKLTAGDTAALRKEIYDLGAKTGVDPDKILAGLDKLERRSGIEAARKQIEMLARASGATGADMEALAQVSAALSDNLGVTAADTEKAINALIKGKVQLGEFAPEAANLANAFGRFGKRGADSVAELGAMLRALAPGFANSTEAAGGLEALMRSLERHEKELRGKGINPFEAGNDGRRHLKDLQDIIDQIQKKTAGDEGKIQELLGKPEAVKAYLLLMNTGKQQLAAWAQEGKNANTVNDQLAANLNTVGGAMAQVEAQMKKVFSDAIAGHAKDIVAAFRAMADVMTWIAAHPGWSVGILAGLKAGPTLLRLGSGLLKGGGGAGEVAGSFGAQPVYVVNWPGGVGAPGGGGLAGGFSGAGLLGALAPAAAAGTATYFLTRQLGDYIMRGGLSQEEIERRHQQRLARIDAAAEYLGRSPEAYDPSAPATAAGAAAEDAARTRARLSFKNPELLKAYDTALVGSEDEVRRKARLLFQNRNQLAGLAPPGGGGGADVKVDVGVKVSVDDDTNVKAKVDKVNARNARVGNEVAP